MTASSRYLLFHALVLFPLFVSGASGSPSPAAPEPRGWNGIYRYSFDGGTTAGGSGIVVSYTLVLTPTTCRFTARGFQTDEDIVCTARRAPTSVAVTFRHYGDGGTTDRYGNAVYSVGDRLFTLERRGARVLTRWQGYPLPDERPHPPAVYFTR